jgi:hypothetical protein
VHASVRLDERFLREIIGTGDIVAREPAQEIPKRRLVPPNEQLERASIIIGNDARDEQGIAVGHGLGVAACFLICQ